MKPTKTTCIIELNKDVSIELEGSYYRGFLGSWENPPEDPEFEITNAKIVKGTDLQFIEWNDEFLMSKFTEMEDRVKKNLPLHTQTLFEYFEEKALEILQEGEIEPDYEKD